MTIMRTELFSVPVDCVDMETAIEVAKQQVIEGTNATAILAVNPEKVVVANKDPRIREILSNALLCIPDGIGVVLAARLKGATTISRVPGSELMPELCKLAAENGFPIFLFGANEDVNARASDLLTKQFPDLNIAGRENGYVSVDETDDLIAKINTSGAQILFVALGSPAQEAWIEKYRSQLLNVRVCQGIGGTLDVISGHVQRAPLLMRRLNLEWLYRLLRQPSRLLRQRNLPIFAFWVIKAYVMKRL
jgi:N-acetylglucosaminyldiphosphoundecaprenol N-acetyl-beta-D-mannosaminyltransferase